MVTAHLFYFKALFEFSPQRCSVPVGAISGVETAIQHLELCLALFDTRCQCIEAARWFVRSVAFTQQHKRPGGGMTVIVLAGFLQAMQG